MFTSKLELRTALGSVYRDVLPTLPRPCTEAEIPVIDLSPLLASSASLADRQAVASQIRSAAENTGFFYIKNHGIDEAVIQAAKAQSLAFFRQDEAHKDRVSNRLSHYFNGYTAPKSTLVCPSESVDVRETLAFRYRPEMEGKDPAAVPADVRPYIRGEDFVWDGTAHLPNFKDALVGYWLACLRLARQLVRIFALSLRLPEDYWDEKVTYPGADLVCNYYPPRDAQERQDDMVGLGSHTDLQLFTLLWQDGVGGLQVLNPQGQWIKAPPVEGTLVVNIGDFMMRLCNDMYKSTVHRVYNESDEERVSLPFFFGLNFNCIEGVVPSCTSADNPAKYKPISCGEWCQMRFRVAREDFLEKTAPSAAIVSL